MADRTDAQKIYEGVLRADEHGSAGPTRAGRAGDTQPMPTMNNHVSIQEHVIADIQQRISVGIERYGTALQPFNDRDAVQDWYEELLDAACYVKQRIVERDIRLQEHRSRDSEAMMRAAVEAAGFTRDEENHALRPGIAVLQAMSDQGWVVMRAEHA